MKMFFTHTKMFLGLIATAVIAVTSSHCMQQVSDDQVRLSIDQHIFWEDCDGAQELLLNNAHLVNKQSEEGRTPLHAAVIQYIFNFAHDGDPQEAQSCFKLIQFLLQQPNIDINIQDSDGLTPLMLFFFNKEQFPEELWDVDFLWHDFLHGSVIALFMNRSDLKMTLENKTGESIASHILKTNLNNHFYLNIDVIHKLIHHPTFTKEFLKDFCKKSLHQNVNAFFYGLHSIIEEKKDWKQHDTDLRMYATLFHAFDELSGNRIHESTLHALSFHGSDEEFACNVAALNQLYSKKPVQQELLQQLITLKTYGAQHSIKSIQNLLAYSLKKIGK